PKVPPTNGNWLGRNTEILPGHEKAEPVPSQHPNTPRWTLSCHPPLTFQGLRRQPRPSARSPLDPQADGSIQRIAVAKILKAGVGGNLGIDGVLVVVPVVGASDTDAAPQPLRTVLETDAGNVNRGRVEEIVIEIGNSIDMAAPRLAGVILPACLLVG